MHKFNLLRVAVLSLLMILGLSVSSVYAVPTVIDFGTGSAGAGGTITTDGSGDVIGTGILIGNVTVVNAPKNNGSYGVCYFSCPSTPGFLDFEYGPNGNYFQVTGAIPTLGLNYNSALAFGSFSTFTYNDLSYVVTASGRDTKNPDLLSALGLPTDTKFDFFGFSVAYLDSSGKVTAISTDVRNTSVPEPSALLLTGSGLIGLALWGRKRLVLLK